MTTQDGTRPITVDTSSCILTIEQVRSVIRAYLAMRQEGHEKCVRDGDEYEPNSITGYRYQRNELQWRRHAVAAIKLAAHQCSADAVASCICDVLYTTGGK